MTPFGAGTESNAWWRRMERLGGFDRTWRMYAVALFLRWREDVLSGIIQV